jgi:hypothetical protein
MLDQSRLLIINPWRIIQGFSNSKSLESQQFIDAIVWMARTGTP